MSREIKLRHNFKIGAMSPCMVMLDAGVNHNNDINLAKQLIKSAKEGGADAIKFQTYTADEISTRNAPRYWDSKLDTDGGKSQYDMFKKVDHLPLKAYYELKNIANEQRILFSSSPFGMHSARFLVELGIDFFKIASAEITNLEMIECVAKSGLPIILSTGACTIGEIEKALNVVYRSGNMDVALQHCVLSYPCKDKDANLAKMLRLKEIFPDIPVGYSDHTYGNDVTLAAIALGARTIEKHYTISRDLNDSPDHKFSLTANELPGFVKSARKMESAIGNYRNGFYKAEEKAHMYARKSIVTVKLIKKGQRISRSMLSFKRPGTGIYPEHVNLVVGRIAKRNIEIDEILQWNNI